MSLMQSFIDKTTQQVKITYQIVAKWSFLLTQLTYFNKVGATQTAIAITHKKFSTNWNVPTLSFTKERVINISEDFYTV